MPKEQGLIRERPNPSIRAKTPKTILLFLLCPSSFSLSYQDMDVDPDPDLLDFLKPRIQIRQGNDKYKQI